MAKQVSFGTEIARQMAEIILREPDPELRQAWAVLARRKPLSRWGRQLVAEALRDADARQRAREAV